MYATSLGHVKIGNLGGGWKQGTHPAPTPHSLCSPNFKLLPPPLCIGSRYRLTGGVECPRVNAVADVIGGDTVNAKRKQRAAQTQSTRGHVVDTRSVELDVCIELGCVPADCHAVPESAADGIRVPAVIDVAYVRHVRVHAHLRHC